MSFINAILRVVFDALLYPFRQLHPMVGLVLVSLVFGVFALLIFKWTSDQDKLDRVKRKIHAGLFEIRLFNDDLRAIFRAMFQILRHNLTYLRLSLIPLLVMLPPFVLIVAQLQFYYGYEGLKPGDTILVTMELIEIEEDTEGKVIRPDVRLETPPGLSITGGPVFVPSLRELTWRIAAEEWGDYELVINVGGEQVTKTVQVSEGIIARRSKLRPLSLFNQLTKVSPADPPEAKSFIGALLAPFKRVWNFLLNSELLNPAEPPLPISAGVAKIMFEYPHGNAGIEGWESEGTWLIVFLVLSIVFAFALRKPLGVTI